MIKHFMRLLCLVCLCIPTPSSSQSSTTADVLFILDASGSMWQKMDGEFKVVIAKSVLQKLVDGLPDNTRAGLIAYGHNRKSDCSDIETLIPLGNVDKTAFSDKLKALNPTGMTPIAMSIKHALEHIQNEQKSVTCILVSDGLETCSGDACELVRQAKAKGVQITMHVIGFGLAENDLSALECITQAGGGQYLPAGNAAELGKALEKSIEQPPADGGYLSVGVNLDGKLKDALVKVYKKGEKDELVAGRTYDGASTNPRIFQLPAGIYNVEARAMRMDDNPVKVFQDIRVQGPDTTVLLADFTQVVVEVQVTRNGALSDATVTLLDPVTKKTVSQTRTYRGAATNPAKFRVLPGAYQVQIKGIEIEGAPVKVFDRQEVAAGKSASLSHDFSSGELRIGAMQSGAFVDAAVQIYAKGNNQNIAGGRTYMSEKTNPKTFVLEPGKYRVDLQPVKPKGLNKKSVEVEVTANGVTEQTVEW